MKTMNLSRHSIDYFTLGLIKNLVENTKGLMKAFEREMYVHDRDSIEHEWIGHCNESILNIEEHINLK